MKSNKFKSLLKKLLPFPSSSPSSSTSVTPPARSRKVMAFVVTVFLICPWAIQSAYGNINALNKTCDEAKDTEMSFSLAELCNHTKSMAANLKDLAASKVQIGEEGKSACQIAGSVEFSINLIQISTSFSMFRSSEEYGQFGDKGVKSIADDIEYVWDIIKWCGHDDTMRHIF